jgi:hypothetical protein
MSKRLNELAEELSEQVRSGYAPDVKSVPGRPSEGPSRVWARRAANVAMKALDGGVKGSNGTVVPSFLDPAIYTDPQLPTLV